MFSSLAYVIVLMGCSDDMSLCGEMARDNRVYATLDECETAQDAALQSNIALKIDYPVVAAKCIQGGERFAKTGATYIGQ